METQTRTCTKCRETFPATNEYFVRSTTKGLKLGLTAECKRCSAAYKRQWWRENGHRFRQKQAEYARKRGKLLSVEAWAQVLLCKARSTSRRTGKEYSLTLECLQELWTNQQGRCYWSGVEMLATAETRHPQKISLDRIDSSRGYTPDNVVLCCLAINYAKSCTDAAEFLSFLAKIRSVEPAAKGIIAGTGRSRSDSP